MQHTHQHELLPPERKAQPHRRANAVAGTLIALLVVGALGATAFAVARDDNGLDLRRTPSTPSWNTADGYGSDDPRNRDGAEMPADDRQGAERDLNRTFKFEEDVMLPTDGATIHVGSQVALANGIIHERLTDTVFMIGMEGSDAVLLVALTPDAARALEGSPLTRGSRVAIIGTVRELPSQHTMREEWHMDDDDAQSMTSRLAWYIEATNIVRHEADTETRDRR
ncbi:MAG: hypothetical protein Q7T01_04425 [bacterium]|nr:hypothetical protein [bacterium]